MSAGYPAADLSGPEAGGVIDLLFLAKNRLEFTRASVESLIANTDWTLVRKVHVYDDSSADGTREYLAAVQWPVERSMTSSAANSPVALMNDFLRRNISISLFAKIDNDVIVPPGWLNAAASVMESHPELDLLGLEPPMSRTRAPWSHMDPPQPELQAKPGSGYAACDSIGGIGLMRRSAFANRREMRPFSTYGGFTDWQQQHSEVKRGWIVPPINLFLLDRLPIQPWANLSRKYIRQGWQRPWANYSLATKPLWNWWQPAAARVA
jgi:hypothetical protein